MIMIPTTKVNTKKLYKVFHKKTAAAASAAHDDDYGGWRVDFTWSLRGIYEFFTWRLLLLLFRSLVDNTEHITEQQNGTAKCLRTS